MTEKLTKEECVKALNALYFSDGTDGRDDECYNVLMELINEHFDNPPLSFEEMKEGDWVWDNVGKEFLKVEIVCVAEEDNYIFKEGTKFIKFILCGISSMTMDVVFEPNRFYRKKVEE